MIIKTISEVLLDIRRYDTLVGDLCMFWMAIVHTLYIVLLRLLRLGYQPTWIHSFAPIPNKQGLQVVLAIKVVWDGDNNLSEYVVPEGTKRSNWSILTAS